MCWISRSVPMLSAVSAGTSAPPKQPVSTTVPQTARPASAVQTRPLRLPGRRMLSSRSRRALASLEMYVEAAGPRMDPAASSSTAP